MNNELIHVDEQDCIIGFGEKISIHKKGHLHRAFSLFIYSKKDKKFLMQKRSLLKYHSGGKWSNSCCSHPYKNETWYEALQRSVSNELNLSLEIGEDIHCDSKMSPQFLDEKLFFSGSFIYQSNYENLSEHELDYVFIYVIDSTLTNIPFNKSEVSEVKWQTKNEIKNWLKKSPDDFSSWFKTALSFVESNFVNNPY